MDERLDAILSEYEELWRRAALENAKQMNVDEKAPGPWRACAWLAAAEFGRPELVHEAQFTRVPWRGKTVFLSGVMAHINNVDKWTWDMFAGKFRDALAEGMTP